MCTLYVCTFQINFESKLPLHSFWSRVWCFVHLTVVSAAGAHLGTFHQRQTVQWKNLESLDTRIGMTLEQFTVAYFNDRCSQFLAQPFDTKTGFDQPPSTCLHLTFDVIPACGYHASIPSLGFGSLHFVCLSILCLTFPVLAILPKLFAARFAGRYLLGAPSCLRRGLVA